MLSGNRSELAIWSGADVLSTNAPRPGTAPAIYGSTDDRFFFAASITERRLPVTYLEMMKLRSLVVLLLALPLLAPKCVGEDVGEEEEEEIGAAEDASGGDGGDSASASDASASDDAAVVPDATVDAGTLWIVFRCYETYGSGGAKYRAIDSAGNRFYGNGFGPKAGSPSPMASTPPTLGATTWPGPDPVVDLPALLAATAAIEVSGAGATTTDKGLHVGFLRHGALLTASGAGAAEKMVDGFSQDSRSTTTRHNDPAASEIRNYNCVSYLGPPVLW